MSYEIIKTWYVDCIKEGYEANTNQGGKKMNPKYWRVKVKDHKSICPWCNPIRENNHITGDVCEHVAKLTNKGIVFYFWGFRPIN